MVPGIKTLIVDDEIKSLSTLRRMLEKYCTDVDIINESHNVKQAVENINALHPQLVFLDISMPDGQGFDVLEQVTYKDFEVVFVTAYDEYATKAFEFSALHYILKPINHRALVEAVNRVFKRKEQSFTDQKLEVFKQSMLQRPERIILPTSDGMEVIFINSIVRCEADGNYTTVYLKNGEKKIISKSLSNFEKLLSDYSFCRLHNSHIINLKFMTKYVKGKAGYVVMWDNEPIYISARRKQHFLDKLNTYAHSL